MLKIDSKYIIFGCPVMVNWSVSDSSKGFYFLRINQGFWFWKKYTPVPSSGQMQVIATNAVLNVRIIQLSRKGFKTIDTLSATVRKIDIREDSPLPLNNCSLQPSPPQFSKTKPNQTSFNIPAFSIMKNKLPNLHLKFLQ